MLTLALLRHAKSSSDDPDLDDFDRPLNARGLKTAPLMGQALRDLGVAPGVILCSPARRTRDTLELARLKFAGSEPDIRYDRALYLTTGTALLAAVRQCKSPANTLLVVGHNPGLHDLALMLAGSGNRDACARLDEKFPTGALAVFTFPHKTWRDIAPKAGQLAAFITPKDRA